MKFDKNGRFLKTWGKKGKGIGEFDLPHTLAFDSQAAFRGPTAKTTASRFSTRTAGSLPSGSSFGRPSGIFIDKNDVLYVGDSESAMASQATATTPAAAAAFASAARKTAQ